jgi:hypothetical protein
MLRKKLMLSLGPLVALVTITAVVAIWLLQGVLADLQHLGTSWDGTGGLRAQHEHIVERLRWLVLGLSMVFLLVVNVLVVVLLRAGAMVVRPVDKLVAATRELGSEHLDYRVEIAQSV